MFRETKQLATLCASRMEAHDLSGCSSPRHAEPDFNGFVFDPLAHSRANVLSGCSFLRSAEASVVPQARLVADLLYPVGSGTCGTDCVASTVCEANVRETITGNGSSSTLSLIRERMCCRELVSAKRRNERGGLRLGCRGPCPRLCERRRARSITECICSDGFSR